MFVVDGKKYGPSGATDDQDIRVTVVDKQHPITKGISDFTIHDETYHKYYTSPDVKVLLTTDHPKNEPPIAWVQAVRQEPRVLLHARPRPFGLDQPELPSHPAERHSLGGGKERKDAGVGDSRRQRICTKRTRTSRPPSAASTSAADSSVSTRPGNLVAVDLASDRVSVSDADLPCLLALPHLKQLKLSGSGISNAGVRQISSLAGLTELSLLDAQIDDAGLGATRSADEPHFAYHPAKPRS